MPDNVLKTVYNLVGARAVQKRWCKDQKEKKYASFDHGIKHRQQLAIFTFFKSVLLPNYLHFSNIKPSMTAEWKCIQFSLLQRNGFQRF